jgi:hypothetical protein
MPANSTASPSTAGESTSCPPRPSLAFRLGRFVQAIVLAIAVAAVVMGLLRADLELTFRYGGF